MTTDGGSLRVGFIGAGRMAQALAQGLVRAGLLAPHAILASDVAQQAREHFLQLVPEASWQPDNRALCAAADVVVLAVKPAQLDEVARAIHPVSGEKLVVSILAGVQLATLSQRLGTERLIRVMPNTPCLVGQGASGFARGAAATDEDQQLVDQFLSSVGLCCNVPESLLDAVTGLSGSGPAFVFLMIEALADGGVRMGLAREDAQRLAAQTVKGAAQLVLESDEHPAVLRDRVASPGGTTIAGLQVLEQRATRAALIGAVEAAARRSCELGQQGP